MRSVVLWLTSALMALVFAGSAVPQPPLPKDGGSQRGGGPGRSGADFVIRDDRGPRRLGADDVVARLLSFDKNKDGQLTADELPERLQHLIAQGDTNKDSALGSDEIVKLVTGRVLGAGAPGTVVNDRDVPTGGAGTGAVGEFRGGGTRGPGARGGPLLIGQNPGRGGVEGVVDDLKLSGRKKEEAHAAVKAHHENIRKLMDQARVDLLKKMKEVLSEEEYKDFKAALERGGGDVRLELNFGPPRGAPATRSDR